MYRLFVGLLLAQSGKLRLDRRFEQTFVTILYGLSNESATRGVAIYIMVLQTTDTLLVIRGYAYAQYPLALASAHGQQTMGRTTFEGLLPVEII